jgi:hypothetical protein
MSDELVRKGKELLRHGQWKEARAAFEHALRLEESAEALDGLGSTMVQGRLKPVKLPSGFTGKRGMTAPPPVLQRGWQMTMPSMPANRLLLMAGCNARSAWWNLWDRVRRRGLC